MKKYKNNYPMYMNISPKGNNMSDYEPNDSMEMPIPPSNQMYIPNGSALPEEMEEDNVEADLSYMKEMYPDTCKKIQPYVYEACDKMEFEGSMMYDKYPDKVSIDKITDHICDCMKKDGVLPKLTQEIETTDVVTDEVTMQVREADSWPRDLVKLLLLNELFGRRRIKYGYRGYRDPYNYYEPFESNYYYAPYQTYIPDQQYPYYNRRRYF